MHGTRVVEKMHVCMYVCTDLQIDRHTCITPAVQPKRMHTPTPQTPTLVIFCFTLFYPSEYGKTRKHKETQKKQQGETLQYLENRLAQNPWEHHFSHNLWERRAAFHKAFGSSSFRKTFGETHFHKTLGATPLPKLWG